MPRPTKCRRVCYFPEVLEFSPKGAVSGEPIVLTVDELETINGGKGGISEGDRNDQNTYFRTAKLSDFFQEKKPQQKESRSEVRKINPDYYKQIPKQISLIK